MSYIVKIWPSSQDDSPKYERLPYLEIAQYVARKAYANGAYKVEITDENCLMKYDW